MNVDAILYINLAHRTDRNNHFLSEITKINTGTSNVYRIDAIKHSMGMFGCLLSHIKALEEFAAHEEWGSVAIFEDDFTFYNADISYNNNIIASFMQSFPDWDVLNLSYNPIRVEYQNTEVDYIKRAISTQTASGYIINRRFLPKLLLNFQEARELISRNGFLSDYCVDQYWKKLQPVSNWYILCPAMGYQCDSYSDIEHKIVNYNC
jgi:GR25 family glycosyltransferase involved in LPS biosynthesis